MRLVFAFVALMLATSSYSQDHLTPETVFDEKHEDRLRIVLREAYASDVILGASFHPSFHPESAAALRRMGKRWELIAVQSSVSVFSYVNLANARETLRTEARDDERRELQAEIARYEKRLPTRVEDVRRDVCHATIDARTAQNIKEAWSSLLKRVYDDPDDGINLDGIGYSFFLRGSTQESRGQASSPFEDSRSGRLSTLAEAMKLYCFSKQPKYLRAIKSFSKLALED